MIGPLWERQVVKEYVEEKLVKDIMGRPPKMGQTQPVSHKSSQGSLLSIIINRRHPLDKLTILSICKKTHSFKHNAFSVFSFGMQTSTKDNRKSLKRKVTLNL